MISYIYKSIKLRYSKRKSMVNPMDDNDESISDADGIEMQTMNGVKSLSDVDIIGHQLSMSAMDKSVTDTVDIQDRMIGVIVSRKTQSDEVQMMNIGDMDELSRRASGSAHNIVFVSK